jgi:predicted transcriptional regulator
MLKQQLQKLGLTENEAELYLASLELGMATVQRIAKKAGFERTSTYGIIESLRERGLITTTIQNKKTLYYAEPPEKIMEQVETQKRIAEKIMPELRALTNLIDNKPKIRFFEGKEAIRDIHLDTLHFPNQEVMTWISELGFYQHYDHSFWEDVYMPGRLEKKIWIRAIAPNTEVAKVFQSEDKKWLRKTRINTGDNFIEAIILLYGGKNVGIISTDELVGFVIESTRLYNTLKGLFEMQWQSLQG